MFPEVREVPECPNNFEILGSCVLRTYLVGKWIRLIRNWVDLCDTEKNTNPNAFGWIILSISRWRNESNLIDAFQLVEYSARGGNSCSDSLKFTR